MPSPDRRAARRRRTWGRGPCIAEFERLERRDLMAVSGATPLPDLVNSAFTLSSNVADWGNTVEVQGRVTNQGNATTTAPFSVSIYASSVRGVNKFSVPIGTVTIPAGLAPGQSLPYQSSVAIPSSPIPNVSSNSGTVYVAAWVNQNQSVAESNFHNNRDIGPPYDVAPVIIQAPQPSQLVGTTLAVSAPTTTWGSTVTVTAQVTNKGTGASPPTDALLSLTPQGLNYGSAASFSIGTIPIPALGPSQTYNVTTTITLPAVEPLPDTNYTNFGLTMTQDMNYLTNRLYPSQPDQGLGYDQTPMNITTSSTSTATAGLLPDLAASSILAPSTTLRWGQSFQVSTDVQNLGQGTAGSFPVYFILTGQGGSLTNAVFLGQTTISGLAPGASQSINQTLTLPSRLPAGVNLSTVGYGRVAVIVDPNNTINETLKSNNESVSSPFVIRLPGNATSVPTQPTPGVMPSIASVAQKDQAAARIAAAQRRAARHKAAHPTAALRKLHRHAAPSTSGIVNKGVSLATEITKLPHQIVSVLGKSL